MRHAWCYRNAYDQGWPRELADVVTLTTMGICSARAHMYTCLQGSLVVSHCWLAKPRTAIEPPLSPKRIQDSCPKTKQKSPYFIGWGIFYKKKDCIRHTRNALVSGHYRQMISDPAPDASGHRTLALKEDWERRGGGARRKEFFYPRGETVCTKQQQWP